jgi:hypothetical protein
MNLLALTVLLFGVGWAVTVPGANTLVVIDIGVIAAVGLWFTGQLLRAFTAFGKSH